MTAALASNSTSREGVSHLVSLLRGFESASFVTRSRSGGLHGRPMSIARVDDDVTIWFITSAHSAKINELAEDARAMVNLQGADRFACINGNAEIVFDPRQIRELWKEHFRLWFDGKDDQDIVLVRFTSFDAEYWDNSGRHGIKHAFDAARAYMTGHFLPHSPDNDSPSHARLKLWEPTEAENDA